MGDEEIRGINFCEPDFAEALLFFKLCKHKKIVPKAYFRQHKGNPLYLVIKVRGYKENLDDLFDKLARTRLLMPYLLHLIDQVISKVLEQLKDD